MKTIKIGETEFKLPFKFDGDTGAIESADGMIIYDVDFGEYSKVWKNSLLIKSNADRDKLGQITAEALNLWADGWTEIKSEKDLPDVGGVYLITGYSHVYPEEPLKTYVVSFYTDERGFVSGTHTVIAWRPLPEPFQPEKP
jgi:hypothetical protein